MTNKVKWILALTAFLAACTTASIGGHGRSPHPVSGRNEYAKTAVMITNPEGNSGGTGVILESHPGFSQILTNKHVCQLAQTGGKVITDNGKAYKVDTFRVYTKHDLCLIGVYADLGVTIKVAQEPPREYDTSIVVGHPALYPTIITTGHFSQKRIISLVVGMKACDGTESGDDMMMCMFMGGKPILAQLSAQMTSSLIMPGSSGSAVYNNKGELSGLIFAGASGLGYGFLVPWEYINNFLTDKQLYKEQMPDPNVSPKNFFTSYFKLEELCESKSISTVSNFCKSFKNLGLWHK